MEVENKTMDRLLRCQCALVEVREVLKVFNGKGIPTANWEDYSYAMNDIERIVNQSLAD